MLSASFTLRGCDVFSAAAHKVYHILFLGSVVGGVSLFGGVACSVLLVFIFVCQTKKNLLCS